MDYAMPRADNLPSFSRRHHGHALSLQPARREGLRGGGVRSLRRPAVINAITDARRSRACGHAGDRRRIVWKACSTRAAQLAAPVGAPGSQRAFAFQEDETMYAFE